MTASARGGSSISRKLAAVAIALALLVTGGSGQERKMADPYTTSNNWILLTEMDPLVADGAEWLEATTPRMFAVFYNQVTNRIVILGDDDGRKEIPTLDPNTDFATGCLMLNLDGDLAQSPTTATAHPTLEFDNNPTGVRWPAGTATIVKEGQVMGVSTVTQELALDGTTSVDRAQLAWHAADIRLSETISVNLNVTTKSVLYEVPTGRSCVITKIVIRAASTSLTTAQFSFGFNANADDVIPADLYDELTTSGKYTIVAPQDGAVLGAAGEFFGVKCTTAQGAAATVTIDVFGYLL